LTHPPDWGKTLDRPRVYRLPEDQQALRERYLHGGPSPQFEELLSQADSLGATVVFVEVPYVDFDYRAEYSNLYARSFRPPPDKTERLLFFRETKFLGFSALRPSHKPVGRTAISPPPREAPFVTCLAPHAIHPYGRDLPVDAYPFVSQDGQYGRCAHAAIWSIARYHHLRHGTPKVSIAAVVEAAGTREPVDRTFASEGLYLHQVAEAFHGLGLPPIHYDPRQLPLGESLRKVTSRYLNSGFPVALNTHAHLTVLVGYGKEDEQFFFIRSDDNLGAYERVLDSENDRLGEWEMLLVPLPARIHVPAELAELAAVKTLREQSGATDKTLPVRRALEAGDFRLRTYAVEAFRYKKLLAARGPGDEVVNHHLLVPAPIWIWVTEFQSRAGKGNERVYAEVAIDATSHRGRPRPVFANFETRCVAWLPEDSGALAKDVQQETPYATALPGR
jgi:hypothetical protein